MIITRSIAAFSLFLNNIFWCSITFARLDYGLRDNGINMQSNFDQDEYFEITEYSCNDVKKKLFGCVRISLI